MLTQGVLITFPMSVSINKKKIKWDYIDETNDRADDEL